MNATATADRPTNTKAELETLRVDLARARELNVSLSAANLELTRSYDALEKRRAAQAARLSARVAQLDLQLAATEDCKSALFDKVVRLESPAYMTNALNRRAAINGLCAVVHDLAKTKGWYDGTRELPELVALIHSEASEVLEAYRETKPGDDLTVTRYVGDNFKPEGIASELADIVIRTCDTAAHLKIDLGKAIEEKHHFNTKREPRHGGKRC